MGILVVLCSFFGHDLYLDKPWLYADRFSISCTRCGGHWGIRGHDHAHDHLGTKPEHRPATSIPLKQLTRFLVKTLVSSGSVDESRAADLLLAANEDPWIVMKPFTTSG